MGAGYYTADTENGDHADDPSEDSLFELIKDLNRAQNTFLTITPPVMTPPGTPRSPCSPTAPTKSNAPTLPTASSTTTPPPARTTSPATSPSG